MVGEWGVGGGQASFHLIYDDEGSHRQSHFLALAQPKYGLDQKVKCKIVFC